MTNWSHLGIKRVAAGATILLCGVLFACRRSEPAGNRNAQRPQPHVLPSISPSAPAVAIAGPAEAKVLENAQKFDHNLAEHKRQSCDLCHSRIAAGLTGSGAAPIDVNPAFPGHAACIDCHGKDYTSTTSQLCVVCHKMPLEAQPQLISFPAQEIQFGLKSFSHRDHLDPGKMPAGTSAAKCDTCHHFDSGFTVANFPGHTECYSCHTHQAGQKLGTCQTCHAAQSIALRYTKGAGPAHALYNFTHGSHFRQASIGQSCDKCHHLKAPVPPPTLADIYLMSTARGQRHTSGCWSCHVQAKEPTCTKCHVGGPPV
ncbi:MAG TPA: hypothetical protein VJX67_22465 [Blastocatellia bacterium]|nr:hypothetical protein [Blastocatellia bacterium]